MQAIIVCAGKGTRISEYSRGLPKCLLQIGGRTVIERQIEATRNYCSSPPIVVVGYRADDVRDRLKGEEVIYEHNADYATTNVLTSLWHGLRAFTRGRDLLYLPGDLVFESEMIGLLVNDATDICIAVEERRCDDEAVKVVPKGGKVASVGKGISARADVFEFIGMMKVKADTVPLFIKTVDHIIAKGGKGAYVYTALQQIIDSGAATVGYVDISGHKWEEIDFAEDCERAKNKFDVKGAEHKGG